MRVSDGFRFVWWLILVIAIGYYLYGRFPVLIDGNPSYMDAIVFIVWVGVCLAPIFQEMDLFGLKLKQKIEQLNKDVVHEIDTLKTEIKASLSVHSANNNQIYFQNSAAPLDSEIPDLKQQIESTLAKMGVSSSKEPEKNYGIDPIYTEMFEIRLAFEKLVREYTGHYDKSRRRYTLGKMLNELLENEMISKELMHGVFELVAVCNYAVHGEPLTEKQVDFVRESAPGLLAGLRTELKKAVITSQ